MLNILFPFVLQVLVFLLHSFASGETKVIRQLSDPDRPTEMVGPADREECICSSQPRLQSQNLQNIDLNSNYDSFPRAESISKSLLSRNGLKKEEEINNIADKNTHRDSPVSRTQTKAGESKETMIQMKQSKSFYTGTTENPNVIRQVIFIEPPEYIYKHEVNIKPVKEPPRTVIYVFPPQVKHEYNITDARLPIMMDAGSGPIVYYLSMNDLGEEQQFTDETIIKKSLQSVEVQKEKTKNVKNSAWDQADPEPHDTIENYNKYLSYLESRMLQNKMDVQDEVIEEEPILDGEITKKQLQHQGSETLQKQNRETMLKKKTTNLKIDQRRAQSIVQSEHNLLNYINSTPTSIPIAEDDNTKSVAESKMQTSSNVLISNSHTDDAYEAERRSDFEIIPAILQSYFYEYIEPNNEWHK
jgi:hypothetical protein